MSRTTALCLLCGLLAVGAAQAALRSEDLVDEVVAALKEWVSPYAAADPGALENIMAGEEDEKFHLVTKYKVEPKCHREFAKKYLETRKELEGEQGNKKMKLFKIWNDNTILLGYSEWENKKAFLESVKSEKAKPLKEYIQENDVPVFLCGMCPIEQMKPSTVTSHAYNFGGFDSGALDFGISHGLDEHMVSPMELLASLQGGRYNGGGCKPVILSKHCVRPSLRKDFVSFYLEKISELKDVEGLQATCLAKTFEDNISFMGYEEWESKEKLHEYLQSDKFKKKCQWIKENNVPTKICVASQIEQLEDMDKH